MPGPARPPDLLAAGDDEPRPRRRLPLLLAAVVGAVVLLASGAVQVPGWVPGSGQPQPSAAPRASLLVTDDLAVSQTGVLVLPVRVVNPGPALRIVRATVHAEPVAQPPAAGGATRVAAGRSARVVALVQPHCALLRPRSGLRFSATVAVRLAPPSGPEQELFLDLGQHPQVADRVRRLCLAGGPLVSPGLVDQGFLRRSPG